MNNNEEYTKLKTHHAEIVAAAKHLETVLNARSDRMYDVDVRRDTMETVGGHRPRSIYQVKVIAIDPLN